MSEALHPTPTNQPTGEVIPLHQNPEQTDFSDVGPEIAISYLLSELRHPAYSRQNSLELSSTIIDLTTARPDDNGTSHQARLEKLIDESPVIADDELWDKKNSEDTVFRLLVEKLRTNKDRDHEGNSLRMQRSATRRLLGLRGTFSETNTPNDHEWEDLLERIFS